MSESYTEVSQKMQQAMEFTITPEESADFIQEFMPQVEKAINDRQQWANNIAECYMYEQGRIGKPSPDLPFPGSSNIRPLTSLGFERQLVPQFVASVWDAPHVVHYMGGMNSDSRQEQFCDWQFKAEMPDFWSTLNAAAWRLIGAPGTCWIKATYDHKKQSVTHTEAINEEMRLTIKMLEDSLAAKKKGMVAPAVAEGGPEMQPAPQAAPQPMNEMPTPLEIIAQNYGWDITDPIHKKRAESVLKQIKDDETDILVAIIERTIGSPLKLTVIDNHNDIITPWFPLTEQESPWIAEWMVYDHRQLKDEAACGKFKNVDAIIEDTKTYRSGVQNFNTSGNSAQRNPQSNMLMQFRNLVMGLSSDTNLEKYVPVFEIQCWRPRSWIARFNGLVEDDETEVRCVINFCPTADPKHAILRAMEHPYDFDGAFNWNYVQIKYNDNRTGIYCGVGIPNLVNAFEREEIVRMNAAIDRTTLMTCQDEYFNGQAFPGGAPINRQRVPGQRFEVMGDPSQAVFIPSRPDLASPLHGEEMRLRQRAKELAGVPDLSGLPSYDRPPTKGQIEATVAPQITVQSHEIKNWLHGWTQVFRMCHSLNKQFRFAGAPSDAGIRFTNIASSAPTFISEEDFAPQFIIRAGGDVNRMDDQQQAQKELAWSQIIGNNPVNAPMVNRYEMVAGITHSLIGPIKAQKWINPPKQAEKYQQQFMQMQAQAMAAAMANKKKRDGGAGEQPASQMGGSNLGNLTMGAHQ